MYPYLAKKLLSRLKPRGFCFVLRELAAEGQAWTGPWCWDFVTRCVTRAARSPAWSLLWSLSPDSSSEFQAGFRVHRLFAWGFVLGAVSASLASLEVKLTQGEILAL